jgi:hypothetical protein
VCSDMWVSAFREDRTMACQPQMLNGYRFDDRRLSPGTQ